MPSAANIKNIQKKLDIEENQCPVERAMRVLGPKWTASILWHIKDNPLRFNELSRQLPKASKKILTQRLQELEDYGFVNRTVKATKPIAVEYSITKFGKSAQEAIHSVALWAFEHEI